MKIIFNPLTGQFDYVGTSGGGGTVTTVSVATANGLAGTVATSTTTPVITLSTTVTGILKGNGTAILAATPGTDYLASVIADAPLTGAGTTASHLSIPKATSAVDGYLAASDFQIFAGKQASLGLTDPGANRIAGWDHTDNAWEWFVMGGGFSYDHATHTLSVSGGGGGTVTQVSVVSANGFAGTVANDTTTPAITLTTSITGILKGNGTAISAATPGVDYLTAESDTLNSVLTRGNTSLLAITAGGIRSGSIGVTGQFSMYSHISPGVDWITSINPNAAQSANANFYLPAAQPAATYLLNMTAGGVIGYDTTAYLSGLTVDSPLSGAGTSASHLTISAADSTHDGYLSQGDWAIFNGKQNALSFPLAANLGGTGIANNAASTIAITGAFGITLTVTNTTALTLPIGPGTVALLTDIPVVTNFATKALNNLASVAMNASLQWDNTAARTFDIAATANTVVGRALTISAGSTVTGGTADMAGGNLTLNSGLGKGTGESSIIFQTGRTLTTGSTLQTLTEAMRILGSGRIGIGTSNPLTQLTVADTSTSSPRGILSQQFSDSTDGARVGFSKARGSVASPSIVQTGDMLGRLMFRGYDGANYLEMGSIDVGVSGTVASTRVPTYLAFNTATDAAPSVLTERMRILNNGNVGIGMTNPAYALDVVGSGHFSNYLGVGVNPSSSYSGYFSHTGTDSTFYGLRSDNNSTITTTGSINNFSLYFANHPIVNTGATNSGSNLAEYGESLRNSNGSAADDSGTLANLGGIQFSAGHYLTNPLAYPTTTNVYGIRAIPYIDSGTITNYYGLYFDSKQSLTVPSTWASGTAYALNNKVKPSVSDGDYFVCTTAGTSGGAEPAWNTTLGGTTADGGATWTAIPIPAITNYYAVYQPETSAKNYFGGNVGIGTTSPTAYLTIKAGTATANTAPLKLISGVLNTNPEVGALEFVTDTLSFTITTGTARKTIAFTDSAITSSMYIGTTSVALNRASGALALTGVSIDGSAGSVTGLSVTAGKTLTVSDSATIATNSITLAGGEVITFSATNAITFATTAGTSVTLPTSGTLVSSVTTANGVSATNTAGALSFTLGAITPTTINGTHLSLGNNSIATNVAVGIGALAGNNSGTGNNTAVGSQALTANTSGINNSALGLSPLSANTTGSGNTGLGSQALYALIDGSENTAVGHLAGLSNIHGNFNVFLGYCAGRYELGSNAFYVDNEDRTNTAGDKAGALLYGTFDATPANQTLRINAITTYPYKVGIGNTNAPKANLHIVTTGQSTSGIVLGIDNSLADGFNLWYTDAGNTTCYLDSFFDSGNALFQIRMRTAGTPVIAFQSNGSGTITLPSLAGSGSRAVNVDANGVLSAVTGGANTALSNLASVAINTTLLPGANDGAALGDGTHAFSDLFLAAGGVINWNNGNMTLTHSAANLTFAGGTVNLGTGATATSPVFTTQITTPSIITASGALTITPATGSNLNIVLGTTGDLAVNTSQLYVDTSTGKVGVGTSEPSERLHVLDPEAATNCKLVIESSVGNSSYLVLRSGYATAPDYNIICGGDGGSLLFYNNGIGAQRMSITQAGVVTINNLAGSGSRAVNADANGVLSAASDERMKTEFKDLTTEVDPVSLLKDDKIKAVYYYWKDPIRGTNRELGMTYQMFKDILPEIAGTEGPDQHGYLDYQKISVVLWEQNRQLLARIEKLEQK